MSFICWYYECHSVKMNPTRFSAVVQAFLLWGLVNLATPQQEQFGQLNRSDRTYGTADSSLPVSGFVNDDRAIDNALHDGSNFSSTLCQKAHSCSTSSEESESLRLVIGCSCHDYCRLFSSCCHDKIRAPTTHRLQPLPRDAYVCTPTKLFSSSVYMVTSCPSSYTNELVSVACSHKFDFKEPRADLSTPVTDRDTGVTYRNVYCATCWSRSKAQTSTWLWRYSCRPGVQHLEEIRISPAADDIASDGGSQAYRLRPADGDRYEAALDFVRRSCNLSYSPPPELRTKLHQCRERLVDRCPDSVPVGDPRRIGCTSGPTAYAYGTSAVYRNVDCAACDAAGGPDALAVGCQPPPYFVTLVRPKLSFAVLLTPDTDRCVATEGTPRSEADRVAAELCVGAAGFGSERLAAGGGEGVCPPGSVREDGVCRLANRTQTCTFPEHLGAAAGVDVLDTSFVNSTLVALVNETTALCFSCVVEQHTNFSVVNGSLSAVVDGELRRYDSPLYSVDGDRASVCVSLSAPSSMVASTAGCSAVPGYVSAIALCLSEVCLILFAAAYALLKYLRRFPGEMVLNECVAFFLAFLLFLLRPLTDESSSACTALAVSIHYLLVAAFTWTSLYSVEIARVLSFKVFKVPQLRRRVVYYVIGWGVPLVCIALGTVADAYSMPFRPRYGGPDCFIGSRFGNLILFMAPLCVFLSIDVAVYGFMVVKLAIIARQTKMARSSHNEKLWLSIKLIFSLGILWLVAVLASFTGSEVLYCIFSHLNSLQGVFVFFVFIGKRDTVGSLRQRVTTLRSTRSHSGAVHSRLFSKTSSSV